MAPDAQGSVSASRPQSSAEPGGLELLPPDRIILDGVEISIDLLRRAFAAAPTRDLAEWRTVRAYRDGNVVRFEVRTS